MIECTKCNIFKDYLEFHKGNRLNGFSYWCKDCKKLYSKKRTNIIRDTEHIEKELIICPKCSTLKNKKDFSKNRCSKNGLQSRCKKCRKVERDKNQEVIKKEAKKWRDANKEYSKLKNKEYRENNKEKIRVNKNKYEKYKVNTDIIYKFKRSIRGLITSSIKRKNYKKCLKTYDILGCSIEKFKKHIESQFLNWMNWDNYGNCPTNESKCSWHIDHIVPINHSKSEQEVLTLNHWSNFQPMCSKRNNYKKDKLFPLSNIELKITFENSKK